MAIDKRIHELSTTTDKVGKFLALDEAGLSEAQKFSADSLIDKAFTDTLYVKLAGDETVNGIKTWNNQGIFGAGILINLGGIDVTGLSSFDGITVATGNLTVTTLAAAGADELVFADSAGLFKTSGNLTYNGTELTVLGTFSSTSGGFTQRMDGSQFTMSRNSANYIRCSTAAGYFVFITNGLATSTANANLVMLANQESYFNNNLGIKVSDPNTELHVEGNGIFGDQSSFLHSGGTYRLQLGSAAAASYANLYLVGNQTTGNTLGQITWCNLQSGASGKRVAMIQAQYDSDPDAGRLDFLTANAAGVLNTHISILEGGDIGIGTIGPTAKLHINGGHIRFQSDAGAGSGQGELNFNSTTKELELSNTYATDAAKIKFIMSFGTVMTIERNGYTGIGGSVNPESRLDFGSVSADEKFWQMVSSGGDSNFRLFMQQGAASVSNGESIARIGLRYLSGDVYNCGVEFRRGSGTSGGWMSFTADDGTDFVNVAKERGVLDVRIDGANGSSGFGGVVRVSNLDQTILAGEDSGSIEFYKADVSVNGAGVCSRIRSYSFDAGGTFWLGFHTGDASSVSTERFTMTHLGSFHVNNAPSNEGLIVDASVVKNHGLRMDVGGLARWFIYANGTAEGGSETGTNLTIAAYSDLGVFAFGAMNIDRKSGRIGIGGINGTYQLDVQTISTSDSYVARFFNDGGSFGDNGIILKQGLATPIGSTERAIVVQDGNGTEVGSLAYDTTSGLRVISILSRKKFKKNFRPAKGRVDATAMLKAAQPQIYNWKGRTPEEAEIITELGEDQKDILGFVIDDIPEEAEGIVNVTSDPENPGEDLIGISETGFIKYLVKAVEELSERLEALEP